MNTLLICGLQVTLVALVGCLTSLATRRWLRTSAALPIGATLAAVVLLTACAISPWPSWLQRSPGEISRASHPLTELAKPRRYAPEGVSLTPNVSIGSWNVPTWLVNWIDGSPTTNAPSTVSLPPPSDVSSNDKTPWTWEYWLVIFAGGTMLVGLIRLLGGLWSVRLFVRTSRPLQTPALLEQIDLLRAEMGCTPAVDIRECSHLATAATVGWRRPVILLSENWKTWSEPQLKSVLAHEIAHITRGDFLAGVAAQVGVVLHFYHPLVHWLANRLRLEQELAADALAAQVVGGSRAYLHAIGELALQHTNEPVGWPAHTFLPTRRTFLRRIEMLRDSKLLSGKAPLALRWGTLAAIAAVTLVAIGIRPPGGETASPAAAVAADPPKASPTPAPSTTARTLVPVYVPANAQFVLAARPSDIMKVYRAYLEKHPELALRDVEVLGPLTDCETVCVSTSGLTEPVVCMTFPNKKVRDLALDLMRIGGPNSTKKTFATFEYISSPGAEFCFQPDDLTAVVGLEPALQQAMLAGPKSLSPLTQTEAWKQAAQGTVAIAIDPAVMQTMAVQAPPNPIVGMFAPLWDSASNHTLGLKLDEKLVLALTTQAKDDAGAEKISAALAAGIAMLNNITGDLSHRPEPGKAKIDIEKLLSTILNSHKLAVNGKQVTLSLSVDVGELMPLVTDTLIPLAQRTQQQDNLKQVMLALHNYHDTNGHFPPAVVIDKDSGVPHSWRVEILPYIEQSLLYQQYKMNEPWDSENNKKVLALMPAQYRHPSQGASTNTAIFAAYGDGFAFQKDDKEGTKIQDILDGTSSTICVFEAKADIPWTKPEELSIDLSKGVPANFGFTPEVFTAGLCDGSVQYISRSIDKDLLKALFTRKGGESVSAP